MIGSKYLSNQVLKNLDVADRLANVQTTSAGPPAQQVDVGFLCSATAQSGGGKLDGSVRGQE
ncbi:MAG TPA: hypothetical protein VKE40_06925 [Gemmataceae bacterium]|nr:hypothetical protein [Gemmataceae bacterium]